jgi:hypothetical protein
LRILQRGQLEARQLAFICFVNGISKEDLKAMSVPETVDFFGSHGLGVDAVAKAFLQLSAYYGALSATYAGVSKLN